MIVGNLEFRVSIKHSIGVWNLIPSMATLQRSLIDNPHVLVGPNLSLHYQHPLVVRGFLHTLRRIFPADPQLHRLFLETNPPAEVDTGLAAEVEAKAEAKTGELISCCVEESNRPIGTIRNLVMPN